MFQAPSSTTYGLKAVASSPKTTGTISHVPRPCDTLPKATDPRNDMDLEESLKNIRKPIYWLGPQVHQAQDPIPCSGKAWLLRRKIKRACPLPSFLLQLPANRNLGCSRSTIHSSSFLGKKPLLHLKNLWKGYD